jgi:hypothetical protein
MWFHGCCHSRLKRAADFHGEPAHLSRISKVEPSDGLFDKTMERRNDVSEALYHNLCGLLISRFRKRHYEALRDPENLTRHGGPRRGQTPEIRVDKVLDIRRQLGEGTYSIAERLDIVVERIIRDLA